MVKISKATGRSVEEWIGKTPDAEIPDRVRIRIFERYDGRCYLSGVKIVPGMDYDFDHILALEDGGEHRESNLAPVLKAPHKLKTKEEAEQRAKVRSIKKKHFGMGREKAGSIPSRPFSKYEKERKPLTKVVPARSLYTDDEDGKTDPISDE